MSAYTRMVPRARTRIGEVDLECVCGNWIPYPADDGTDERVPSICPECLSEWFVMEAITRPKKTQRRKK